MDKTHCTICQEPLTHDNTAACQCGHTFHYHCILTWYERSKTCPQCRKTFRNAPIRLYFDVPDDTNELDWGTLKTRLNDCNVKIIEHASIVKKKDEELRSIRSHLQTAVLDLEDTKEKLEQSKSTCTALKRQLGLLEKVKCEVQRYKNEAKDLRSALGNLNSIQALVDGEKRDVEEMLKDYSDHGNTLYQLATSFVILKKEFERLKENKENLIDQKKDMRRSLEEMKQKLAICKIDKKKSEQRMHLAESDLQSVELECQHLREKLKIAEEKLTSDSPKTMLLKRQMKESPAPNVTNTPKLSSMEEFGEEVMDNFGIVASQKISSPSQSAKRRKKSGEMQDVMEELGMQKVSICGASQLPVKYPPRIAKPMARHNFASNGPAKDSFISITKTYNGLGGRSRILTLQNKKVSNVKVPKRRHASKDSHDDNPRLPSLDKFFSLED